MNAAATRRRDGSEPPPKIEDHVLQDLQGRCNLVDLAASANVALKKTGKEYRGECPLCRSSKGLSVYHKHDAWHWKCWSCSEGGRAIAWLMKVAGMPFLRAVEALGGDLDELRQAGVSPEAKAKAEERQREREARDEADSERRRAAALKLSREMVPIAGSPGEVYFAGRGILGPFAPSLGYHGEVWTVRAVPGSEPERTESIALPAVLGCVTGGDGRFLAVHRIFLTVAADGTVTKCTALEPKAGKKALGDLCDGACRLTRRRKAGGVLVLTEGIETGLAVAQALRHAGRLAEDGGDCAVWSALYAGQLVAVGLPAEWRPERVVVMADNDPKSRTGETKARQACERFQREFGIPSGWAMPGTPGWDWNDPIMKATGV